MGDPVGEHRGHDGPSPGPSAVAGRRRLDWENSRVLTAEAAAVMRCMTAVIVAAVAYDIFAGKSG